MSRPVWRLAERDDRNYWFEAWIDGEMWVHHIRRDVFWRGTREG